MRAGSSSATISASAGSCADGASSFAISAASRDGERVVAVGQRLLAGRRRFDQRRRVREPRLRLRQRRPFVGGDVERRELAPARLEQLRAPRPTAAAARGRGVALLDRGTPRAPRVARRRAASAVKPPNASTSARCDVGRGERLVRVLAVEVDEPLADLLQLRERRRAAVDPRAAPALRIERAAQQHLAVAPPPRSCSASQAATPGGPSTSNDGGELGALGARPQLAQLEAIAEQQARARRAGSTCRRRFRRSAP